MPKATDEQLAAFAEALRSAMSETGEDRADEWLAERVGSSAQAIRNYLAKLREPKNAEVVERMEDALGKPRHHLGQHLGYGPGLTQRVAELEGRMERLEVELERVARLLESLGPPQN